MELRSRTVHPSSSHHQSQYAKAEMELQELIDISLDIVNDKDPMFLRKHGKDIKAGLSEYNKAISSLINFHYRNGNNEAVRELRESRNEVRTEVSHNIDLLNRSIDND